MKNKQKKWRLEGAMFNKLNGYKNSGRANKPQYIKSAAPASNLLRFLLEKI